MPLPLRRREARPEADRLEAARPEAERRDVLLAEDARLDAALREAAPRFVDIFFRDGVRLVFAVRFLLAIPLYPCWW